MINKLLTEIMNSIIQNSDGYNDLDYSSIRQGILPILYNYEISEKKTEVGNYVGLIPECFKIYIVSQKINGISDNTLKLYNLVLSNFFVSINKRIEDLTTNDIRLYLYQYQEKTNVTNRTLENRRTIIRSFLEWCYIEEYIDKNPAKNINKIKFTVKERTALSSIQLEKIRNACTSKRDRALIEFLYSTGCRVSELINVNISDLDFKNEEVIVLGKGNKYRHVFLNGKALLYLTEYLNSRCDSNEALFVSERKPHDRLTKAAIEKTLKQIGEKANIGEKLYPHKFRHTTATDAVNRGMPIEDVQKMLGHSNINTTMIYAKIDTSHVKSEHRRCIV